MDKIADENSSLIITSALRTRRAPKYSPTSTSFINNVFQQQKNRQMVWKIIRTMRGESRRWRSPRPHSVWPACSGSSRWLQWGSPAFLHTHTSQLRIHPVLVYTAQCTEHFLWTSVADPGCLSQVQDLDFSIPDSGSGFFHAGSRIGIFPSRIWYT